MPLKQFTIDFSELSKHQYLRFDEKFWFTTKNLAVYDYILLKDVFFLINGNSYTEFYTEEKNSTPYVRIGDLTFKYEINNENIIYLDDTCEINEEKKLLKDDLIMATIGTVGKINLAREFSGGTFSNNTTVLRIKDKKNNNPFFYEKLFQSDLLQNYILNIVSKKAQPNLQAYDLENIKIPLIPRDKQDEIAAKIAPIEAKIKELKGRIKPAAEIINQVFARKFGFDLAKFEELKKVKSYYIDFSAFANNRDLRLSVKFHRAAGIFVFRQLLSITDKKIKNFIAEPIVLGKSVSPSDYDENGDYYYISMADIKNWKFEKENARLISRNYSDASNKSVASGDIIIARSGEGTIGKVALIDDGELNGVFADFTMRIRLKNYNQEFAYYYFRTDYFQYLVEINKKGLGNNTNIFPGQIQEFPMIDIPLAEQGKIVDEIKAGLDAQDAIRQKIASERAQIDKIIEGALV